MATARGLAVRLLKSFIHGQLRSHDSHSTVVLIHHLCLAGSSRGALWGTM